MESKRRILFIEDHGDTRDLVKIILEGENYCVTADRTVAGAMEAARTDKFDLYLLDTWLPDGSGFDICERIREFDWATPVLFYSGAAFDSDKLRAIKAGAQGYLVKPCRSSELLRTVATLINRASARSLPKKKATNLVLQDQIVQS